MANPDMWDGSYMKKPSESPYPKRRPDGARSRLGKTLKQAFLDGKWEGNRETWIFIAKLLNLEAELFCCNECGQPAPPKGYGYGPSRLWGELDHIESRGRSGSYRITNGQWLCAGPESCHERKHGTPWPERSEA